ncbi:MAG TPA: hypothetical protein VJO35_03470 [Terriglobales bacterium]|nr:hypothetical protein [Terriglobales bacterium]
MSATFSSERFGWPQIFAGILLLLFVGQCTWLLAREYVTPGAISEADMLRIQQGVDQWHGRAIAGTQPNHAYFYVPLRGPDVNSDDSHDFNHSPLWYLIASAPIVLLRISPGSWAWISLSRAPYLLFGTLLGASLWYVSRRLYGNAGGFIALGLYCFSPAVIRSSVLWMIDPNIGAIWGTFGAVFTAIAVSHTLYAPREVVLWNWRRIVLLGVALALAIGSQFSLAIILPVLLAFMLYLAPERKGAAIAILAAACGVALFLLFAAYFFHPAVFVKGLKHAKFLDVSWRSVAMAGDYRQLLREIAASGPVLVLLIPVTVVVFIAWRRTRYFGNSAPLIMAGLFVGLRLLSPHESGSILGFAAVIFLFVFVAGIAADLLETRARETIAAVLVGLIAANAVWELLALAQVGG